MGGLLHQLENGGRVTFEVLYQCTLIAKGFLNDGSDVNCGGVSPHRHIKGFKQTVSPRNSKTRMLETPSQLLELVQGCAFHLEYFFDELTYAVTFLRGKLDGESSPIEQPS